MKRWRNSLSVYKKISAFWSLLCADKSDVYPARAILKQILLGRGKNSRLFYCYPAEAVKQKIKQQILVCYFIV